MKVIPKKQRIKIYKCALKLYEEELDEDVGICQLLRNLYWIKNKEYWYYSKTPEKFIEFKKYYHPNQNNIRFENTFYNNKNLWRRVVLRLILEELKANEEY